MTNSKLLGNVSGFSLGIEDLRAEKVGGALSVLNLERAICGGVRRKGMEPGDNDDDLRDEQGASGNEADKMHAIFALKSLLSLIKHEGVSKTKQLFSKVCPEVAARRRRMVNASLRMTKEDGAVEEGTERCEASASGREEGEMVNDVCLTESNAAPLVLAMTRELLKPTASQAQAKVVAQGAGGKKSDGQCAVAA